MRKGLVKKLSSSHIDFSFLGDHKGMFSFCNLRKDQVKILIDKFAIYMPDNGRINVAGLNDANLDHVAKSILHVCSL